MSGRCLFEFLTQLSRRKRVHASNEHSLARVLSTLDLTMLGIELNTSELYFKHTNISSTNGQKYNANGLKNETMGPIGANIAYLLPSSLIISVRAKGAGRSIPPLKMKIPL